jgi:hypothetical protein
VFGRLDFPRSVSVTFVGSDGDISVDRPGVLRPGDVVMRPPKPGDPVLPADDPPPNVTRVESVSGTDVQLATPLSPLAPGDELFVANLGRVVTAERDNQGRLEVIDAPLLRVGDAVGTIAAWRQSELGAVPGQVLDIVPLSLSRWPDGLLVGDVIGLTSALFPDVTLRIEDMPELQAQDQVSMSGVDVVGRERFAGTGLILSVDSGQGRIRLFLFDAPEATGREFRPADIVATAPFLRGSALKLIRNQDIFVSWLAVEDPLPMPRTLAPAPALPAPCSPVKES